MKIFPVFVLLFFVSMNLTAMNLTAGDLPVRFYVANHKADCTGLVNQKCLLMKNSEDGQWKYYYDNIDGFEYEEGYDYEILVNKKVIDNPPADGPSFVYILNQVVKKIPTMVISDEDKNFIDDKKFKLTVLRIGKKTVKSSDINIIAILDLTHNNISGKDGCNTFHGKIIIDNNKISIKSIASAEMMCENVSIVKDFYKAINAADNYKISGIKLKLYSGKKLMIVYELV